MCLFLLSYFLMLLHFLHEKHCEVRKDYPINLPKHLSCFERSHKRFFANLFLSQSVAKWQLEYDSAAHAKTTLWHFITSLWCSEHRPDSVAKSGKVQGFSNVPWHKISLLAWYRVCFCRNVFRHSWGLVYGEGGAPGAIPLHNLRITSHIPHQDVPLGGPKYVSFELFGAFLGAWRGKRGRPCYGTFAKPASHFTEGMFPGLSAEMFRLFLLYQFWRILPGIFLGTFSHKTRQIRRQNQRKNPGWKIQIREKFVQPKTGPKKCWEVLQSENALHDTSWRKLLLQEPLLGPPLPQSLRKVQGSWTQDLFSTGF